ncbi:hypothetical protein BKA56DRAFT_216773 [Ilyonectria sp. MPI-CAGE-AT-0026]|nr:hypothetical protein BKA56DRAFT_216773 [Ilyonectria sp. MPI-CAGE-AT-0026]
MDPHSIFATNVTHIPNIRTLRAELDCARVGQRRDVNFYNSVCSYLFTFTSTLGFKGTDLTRWKAPAHQKGLLELTRRFLEDDGNGAIFWPDDPKSPDYRSLQYSKDADRISRAMTQLFWRASQEYRYKGSQKKMADPHYRARRLGLPLPGTEHTSHLGGQGTPEEPFDVDKLVSLRTSSTSSRPIKTIQDEIPIFAVPPRPRMYQASVEETVDESYTQNALQRRPGSLGIHPPSPPVAPIAHTNNEPQGGHETHLEKRPRPQEQNTTNPNSHPAGGAENKPVASSPPVSWFSPRRQRRQTLRPDYVTGDDFFEAIGANESGSDAEPANSQAAGNGPRTKSPLPSPPSAPTADTVRTQAGYGCTGDSLSNNAAEEPQPMTPSLPPRFCPGLHDTPAHIHDTGQGQPPLSKRELDTGRENELRPELEHTPESVFGRAAEHEAGQEADPKPSSQRQRPRPQIIFSVDVSHDENRRWQPKGKFMQMSLRDLVEELPLQPNFSRFTFTLETLRCTFHEDVTLNDEAGFALMKNRFNHKIAASLRAHRGSSDLLFEICIHPIWDGRDDCEGGNGDDDEDIVF